MKNSKALIFTHVSFQSHSWLHESQTFRCWSCDEAEYTLMCCLSPYILNSGAPAWQRISLFPMLMCLQAYQIYTQYAKKATALDGY